MVEAERQKYRSLHGSHKIDWLRRLLNSLDYKQIFKLKRMKS